MNQDIIINIHQIKSAGKTFEGILYREYKKTLCYIGKLPPSSQNIRYKDYPLKLINNKNFNKFKFKLITGHVFFGTFETLYKSTAYITLLRNPLERAISYYYYSLRDDKLNVCKLIKSKSLTLESFLKLSLKEIRELKINKQTKEELVLILHNGQTRMISGDTDFLLSQNLLIEKSLFNIENKFIAVGITEKFKQSVVYFGSKLRWKFPIMYKNTNITPKQTKIQNVSKETKKLFDLNNKADLHIYEVYNRKLNQELEKISMVNFRIYAIDFKNFFFEKYIKFKKFTSGK